MMSDYRGHDRPFPAWFPYVLVAIFVMGAGVYLAANRGSAPPSPQTQEDMSIARFKSGVVTHRRG